MADAAFINSFRNHGKIFYPRRNQKSIPFLSEKITLFPDFYQRFYPLSKDLSIYYLRIILIIIGFLPLIIRYETRFFDLLKYPCFTNPGEPAEKMKGGRVEGWKGGRSRLWKPGSVLIRLKLKNNLDIVAFLFLIAGFKDWQCVKIGEPAAGFGLRNQIKFGFILLPESAAAGLLFGWSLVIGQWGSKVSMGSEALLRHDCMVARDFKNLPEGHHPLNLNLNLNLTLKTRINNSITNYKYRRLSNERS